MARKVKQVKEVVGNYALLTYDELSKISRDDHQEDVRQYDKQQNALALVMIGGLCLISGLIFLVLSFKRVKNKMGGLDFTSLQFFVSVACLVAATILLTIGLVRFFKAHNIRKQLKVEIMEVSLLKKEMMTKKN